MDYCPVIAEKKTFKDVIRSAMTPKRKIPSQNTKHALKKDGVCVVIFVQCSIVLGVIFSPQNTVPHEAQTCWRPAEDMGNHDQGGPGTALRTASLRPRTAEKELGESLQ